MADANTGTSGTLRVTGSVVGQSAAGRWSDVAWSLQLIERVSAGSSWTAVAKAANVSIAGVGQVWSGSYTFDWRPNGLQSQTLASGTNRVFHNNDGSSADMGSVTGFIAASGTSGAGGPTSVTEGLNLGTLTVLPGVPSSVVASRVSDSEATVSWAQSSASNGQPTTNAIRRRINNAAFVDVVTIGAATSTALAAAANQKLEYEVRAANAAGSSAWSATSTPIFTTPAAPSSVVATKDAALDITVAWVSNVAFAEHQHVVEVSTNGGSTWSALATVAAGVGSFKHVAPNAAFVHVYRVLARNTATGSLTSARVQSNSVQLLTAPNAPTLPNLPTFSNRAAAFVVPFTHNPVDTTPQTAFEMQFSTNGGSTWSTTGKVVSAVSSRTVAANTYAANVAVTFRVRTWGQATSGGAEGTGASAWSATDTVTFKTRPTVSITSPANSSVVTVSALTVVLGFAQTEGASFVSASITLTQGGVEVESRLSTTLAATLFDTKVEDGGTYTVTATVLDSNGISSTTVTSTFTVDYTEPVPATVSAVYDSVSGAAQLAVTIPTPGVGQVAAVAVSVSRVIDGVRESIVDSYPVTVGAITFVDTTPTISGVNEYRVRTISADGAIVDRVTSLTTDENVFAFLSGGPQFATVVSFWGGLRFSASPTVESALMKAAGRVSPIALFGPGRSLQVSGSVTLHADRGSGPDDVERLTGLGGIVCYRDPTGRRMFGTLSVTLEYVSSIRTNMQYTIIEAT